MTTITTEWLESVGCSVQEVKDPFSRRVNLKAFDVSGNPYACLVVGSWVPYTWMWKPRFRVKAPSVKETTP